MPYDQFTPNNPRQGAQSYDFSGIMPGMQALQGATQGYNPRGLNSFQYSTPVASSVGGRNFVGGPNVTGRMQSAGPYGTSTPQQVSSAFTTGFGAAASPIMSQGKERMRGMGQGFEGGRLSGGASRQLALRNAQQTGSDLQDVAGRMGGDISQRMLGQQETERGQNYAEQQGINQDYQSQLRARDTGAYAERTQAAGENRQDEVDRRNMQYQAQLGNQQNQANENFRVGGFGDDQARYNSTLGMQGALAQLGAGFQLPQLQSALYGQNLQGWQQFQNMANPTTAGGYA